MRVYRPVNELILLFEANEPMRIFFCFRQVVHAGAWEFCDWCITLIIKSHIAGGGGGGGGGLSSSGKFGNLGPQKYDLLHLGHFFVLSMHQNILLNFQHVLEKNVLYIVKTNILHNNRFIG